MNRKTIFRPGVFNPRGVVLALTLACGLAATAVAQPHDGHGMHGHGMAGQGGMMGGAMMQRMLDQVGATADQKSRVHEIFKAAREDARKQRDAHRALHQQVMQAFSAPVVDARTVETLRQQMLAQQDQSSRRMMQAMLDASQVLTPEQRQKMAERGKHMRDMRERHQREREALQPVTR